MAAPGSPPALLSGPPWLAPDRVWMSELVAGPGYAACLALLVPPTELHRADPDIDHVRVSARELVHAAHSSA